MQRKTLTTLKELRIGDSFVFVKKDQPWRVMARADKGGKVAINQVLNGKPILKYDELKRATTQVVFLRHTIPVGGEECFIEDLQPGDVFHKVDDIIHEYVVVERTSEFFWNVRRLDCSACEKAGKIAIVVFVRHKEIVHTSLN